MSGRLSNQRIVNASSGRTIADRNFGATIAGHRSGETIGPKVRAMIDVNDRAKISATGHEMIGATGHAMIGATAPVMIVRARTDGRRSNETIAPKGRRAMINVHDRATINVTGHVTIDVTDPAPKGAATGGRHRNRVSGATGRGPSAIAQIGRIGETSPRAVRTHAAVPTALDPTGSALAVGRPGKNRVRNQDGQAARQSPGASGRPRASHGAPNRPIDGRSATTSNP
jgi:hypothetical protein